jgi:predicted metal-dependent phosphoesterase TrpH
MTPRDWLLQYMKKEIDCVVITDHNSGAWIDCLKNELIKMEKEKIQGYRKIYLFPGVEISVSSGLHLLAIFDLDKTTDDITSLIGNLQYSGTRGNSDGITSKTFNQSIDIKI